MKRTVLIALVAIAAIVLAYFFFLNPGAIQFGNPAQFTDFTGVDQNIFLTYRDAAGFQIAYPQFYEIETFPAESPVKVRFSASLAGVPEVMQIGVLNDSVESLRSAALLNLTLEERSTLVEGQAFGARIMRYQMKSNVGGLFVQTAIFTCPSFNAALTALIPASAKDDLNAANYMASTFKCPAK
ncbi:TPA: hypothetical protein HA244_05080 [Candidatus Micrarchaeota archaeon]|nr:hypothetical protein [Candidatus Micrarchaeota archaeon]